MATFAMDMMGLTVEQRDEITLRVNDTLRDLRPFLEADGGDITLEELTNDGVVRVRLHGACLNCSMSHMTMKAGIEEAIRKVVPMVRSVEAVDLIAG